MEKSYFIKLTVVLYRITELFPKEEPLRFSLRKKANDILADATLIFRANSVVLAKAEKKRLLERIIKNIDIIQAFFELADKQKWIRQDNFLVLKREYERIAKEAELSLAANKESVQPKVAKNIQQTKPQETVFKQTSTVSTEPLKERHKKILKLLKSRGVVQVKDVKDILPEVTKRTLRRDFDFLLRQGLVGRRGDKNKTEYIAR